MNTVAHKISHGNTGMAAREDDNNLFRVLGKKIVRMFQKENHTLGEYLLLYGLIFTGILCLLLVFEFITTYTGL